MSKKHLLQWIDEISFAATEMNLYLDTHPDDEEAAALFSHYNEERQKALELYAANYAPITLDLLQADGGRWLWASEPWPWEGGDH